MILRFVDFVLSNVKNSLNKSQKLFLLKLEENLVKLENVPQLKCRIFVVQKMRCIFVNSVRKNSRMLVIMSQYLMVGMQIFFFMIRKLQYFGTVNGIMLR